MATRTHPSDQLYHGEVTDFREAMKIIIRGMEWEARDSERFNASLEPDEKPLDTSIFTEYRDQASKALAIYREEVEAAEARVLARLRELGGQFESFAEAMECGDYSNLAW
jgi:hypothetical protein